METVNIFGVDFVFFFGRRFCRFVRHINIEQQFFFSLLSCSTEHEMPRAWCVYTTYSACFCIFASIPTYINCMHVPCFIIIMCALSRCCSRALSTMPSLKPQTVSDSILRLVDPNHKFIKKLFLLRVLKYTQYANYHLYCSAVRWSLLCK